MRKVILLLLLCLLILAFSIRRDHSLLSPPPETEELRPEMVPLYLVTFSIPGEIMKKRCAGAIGFQQIGL